MNARSAFARRARPELARVLRALNLDVTYRAGQGDHLIWDSPAGADHSEAGDRVLDLVGGAGASLFGHNHPVPVRSLDSYVAAAGLSNVDIIKVDVEGFDLAVLRGAAGILGDENGPALFVEYAPESLRSCGFDPIELLDFMFATYPHVLVVNEQKATVRRADRESLVEFSGPQYTLNLIGARRPEHVSAVADFLTGDS